MDGKKNKERGEGKEEMQRSVSTHTVTVICRNRKSVQVPMCSPAI